MYGGKATISTYEGSAKRCQAAPECFRAGNFHREFGGQGISAIGY
jgi:hypothetical protein